MHLYVICIQVMSGSLLTLIAKGEQDMFLTGNPQYSMFKYVWKRHTNFSFNSVEIPLAGNVAWGGLCNVSIPHKGDLVTDVYLRIELPELYATGPNPGVKWTAKVGHAIIEYMELRIGTRLIERIPSEYLEIKSQLRMTADKKTLYYNMIGHKGSVINQNTAIAAQILYVPLPFFFCQSKKNPLPLISLFCHEVEVWIKLRRYEELIQTVSADNVVTVNDLSMSLFVEYAFLEEKERNWFKKSKQHLLIEQCQDNGQLEVGGGRSEVIDLDFNQPVKEIFWVGQRKQCQQHTFAMNEDGFPDYNDYFNWSNSATPGEQYNMFSSFLLQVNALDVISQREAQYYNMMVPFKHHTGTPDTGLFCFSWAEEPEKLQPTGTANFSKFHSTLRCTTNEAAVLPLYLRVYALSYNILEICRGQAALLYQL